MGACFVRLYPVESKEREAYRDGLIDGSDQFKRVGFKKTFFLNELNQEESPNFFLILSWRNKSNCATICHKTKVSITKYPNSWKKIKRMTMDPCFRGCVLTKSLSLIYKHPSICVAFTFGFNLQERFDHNSNRKGKLRGDFR